jgi:hypothetical protein
MNAELFGALLRTMAAQRGDRLLDPAATNDLRDLFGKAEELWELMERVPDDPDDEEPLP